jgi:hypothetical protein
LFRLPNLTPSVPIPIHDGPTAYRVRFYYEIQASTSRTAVTEFRSETLMTLAVAGAASYWVKLQEEEVREEEEA